MKIARNTQRKFPVAETKASMTAHMAARARRLRCARRRSDVLPAVLHHYSENSPPAGGCPKVASIAAGACGVASLCHEPHGIETTHPASRRSVGKFVNNLLRHRPLRPRTAAQPAPSRHTSYAPPGEGQTHHGVGWSPSSAACTAAASQPCRTASRYGTDRSRRTPRLSKRRNA